MRGLYQQILLLTAVMIFVNSIARGQSLSAQHTSSKGARLTQNGHSYDTYCVEHPAEKIKMFWKDNNDKKLESIQRLKTYAEQTGKKLVFATNAGIFMTNNTPLGLYIENGRQYRPVNLRTSDNGNFYMRPNGVFLLTETGARIIESGEFPGYKGKVLYATQSGPLLMINNVPNGSFTKGSANVNIRSGVGITADGKVIFAISNEPVNFYDFASFFKDELKCTNALYLDGAICRMYIPELNRMETDGDFGAMIGVLK